MLTLLDTTLLERLMSPNWYSSLAKLSMLMPIRTRKLAKRAHGYSERGNYNVTIKAGTAVGKGASLGGEAVPMATAFNINVPKTLTLTVKNQTVHKNDPITILDELVAGNEGADGITIAEDLQIRR